MELLVVECEDRDDGIVVHAKGDVDSSTVGELVSHLKRALQLATTHPAQLVVIDLQAVTFFGSAGLNAVLNCRDAGLAADTSVLLVADGPHVLRPIEVTNLDQVLEIYPTLADALRSRDPDKQP